MILAIDAGNTDVVFGIWQDKDWAQVYRIDSHLSRQYSDYEIRIRQLMLDTAIDPSGIERVILSSVVPDLTPVLIELCEHLFGKQPLTLDASVLSKLNLGAINPHELGSDLAANAVGAFAHFGQSAIVVDFGTALTFTSVNDKGEILGVAITPGVKTAMKSLSSNTAKLPEIPLEIPRQVIGSNTIEALQAGIMKGYEGLVRHMVAETKKEMGGTPKVVATGGLSFVFEPLQDTFDLIDAKLTLNGLIEVLNKF